MKLHFGRRASHRSSASALGSWSAGHTAFVVYGGRKSGRIFFATQAMVKVGDRWMWLPPPESKTKTRASSTCGSVRTQLAQGIVNCTNNSGDIPRGFHCSCPHVIPVLRVHLNVRDGGEECPPRLKNGKLDPGVRTLGIKRVPFLVLRGL